MRAPFSPEGDERLKVGEEHFARAALFVAERLATLPIVGRAQPVQL
jgi:hypothetical protein